MRTIAAATLAVALGMLAGGIAVDDKTVMLTGIGVFVAAVILDAWAWACPPRPTAAQTADELIDSLDDDDDEW